MKKIALLAVFSLWATISFAQFDAKTFQFGVHVSPTISWLTNNADNDAVKSDGAQMAFKLGMDGEYYFSEQYAIKTGLSITFNQGGSLAFAGLDSIALFKDSQGDKFFKGDITSKFKYQYVEIPLGLKMRTNQVGYFRYFAEIPVFTFGLNTAARADINDKEFKIGKDTGFLQVSWGLGGGLEYAVSESTSLTGSVYYQSGIINTFFAKEGQDVKGSYTKPQSVEIRIGVLF